MSGKYHLKRKLLPGLVLALVLLAVRGSALTQAAGSGEQTDKQHQVFLPVILTPGFDIKISGVQVIQGTAADKQFQVFIAGRATRLRVFVATDTGNTASDISAKLCGHDSSGKKINCITPDNGPITTPSKEGVLDSTLNFTVPAAWLQVGYGYNVLLTGSGLSGDANSKNNRFPRRGIQPFGFVLAPPLDVMVVPVEYKPATDSKVFLPQSKTYDYLSEYPVKLMPVPSANIQSHPSFRYAPKEAKYDLDNPNGWTKLLEKLRAVHLMEDPSASTNYYGLVNVFDAHGCADGCIAGIGSMSGDMTALGWSGKYAGDLAASLTMAHELGHNFGRKHVACTGLEADPDKNYPYEGGLIGRYGWDVTGTSFYDPEKYADYMSYCENVWTSDYTYWSIFQFRNSVSSATTAVPLQPTSAMFVSGMISPAGEVSFQPVYRQAAQVRVPSKGSHVLELLSVGGEVLASYPFTPDEIADAPGFQEFAFFLPDINGVSGFRVRKGTEILGERLMPGAGLSSQPGAAIQSKSPMPESLGADRILHWNPANAAGESVVYRLRLSQDGGKTWQVLALDWPEASYTLPDGVEVNPGKTLVEVQASDGFHTSTQMISLE